MTNKELLVKIETDICWIKQSLSNHLRHHERFAIAWFTAGVAAVVAVVIALLW